jgi:hypothetical protein
MDYPKPAEDSTNTSIFSFNINHPSHPARHKFLNFQNMQIQGIVSEQTNCLTDSQLSKDTKNY